jgi:mycofactocin precursor
MTDEAAPTVEPTETAPAPAPAVEQDLLVEDVSIDGMCGVY